MKKNILVMAFGMAAMLMTSCGGGASKQMVMYQRPIQYQQQPIQQSQPQASTNPFGETFTMPTFEPDTEEYFAATGTANGAKERMDVLQQAALTNAQNMIRQKMKHAYQGVISDYTNYMGINAASDAATKMERGGDQIIDVIVNETMARDVRFSGVDTKGNVQCFVGIRIYKKKVVDEVVEKISEDQELKLRFKEEQFRERMQNVFKNYKESQKQ